MENKYKNKEETYFSYYLDELSDNDIISSYTYEEETFELSGDILFSYVKETQLKTKVNRKKIEKSLLKPCTYTPDFIIEFYTYRKGFIDYLNGVDNPTLIASNLDGRCYIDVKGIFAGRTNSTQYTFPLKQKWIYQKYGIYTNKVVPEKLFANTFTPQKVINEEVYKRDIPKRGIKAGDTKLKYKVVTIKEWLKTI